MAVLVDISKWDMSNVTDMSGMFENCTMNEDISGWNTSSCTNMKNMFKNNTTFNQPIGSWNVSNVINMDEMFRDAVSFEQDISSWNISNVPLLPIAFAKNSKLSSTYSNLERNPFNTNNFNTPAGKRRFYYPLRNTGYIYGISDNSAVAGGVWMDSYGRYIDAVFIPYDGIYTSQPLTITENMFRNNVDFNDPDIVLWDMSTVRDMSYMFFGCTKFNQPIGEWDISGIKGGYMHEDFLVGCWDFNQDLSNWGKYQYGYMMASDPFTSGYSGYPTVPWGWNGYGDDRAGDKYLSSSTNFRPDPVYRFGDDPNDPDAYEIPNLYYYMNGSAQAKIVQDNGLTLSATWDKFNGVVDGAWEGFDLEAYKEELREQARQALDEIEDSSGNVPSILGYADLALFTSFDNINAPPFEAYAGPGKYFAQRAFHTEGTLVFWGPDFEAEKAAWPGGKIERSLDFETNYIELEEKIVLSKPVIWNWRNVGGEYQRQSSLNQRYDNYSGNWTNIMGQGLSVDGAWYLSPAQWFENGLVTGSPEGLHWTASWFGESVDLNNCSWNSFNDALRTKNFNGTNTRAFAPCRDDGWNQSDDGNSSHSRTLNDAWRSPTEVYCRSIYSDKVYKFKFLRWGGQQYNWFKSNTSRSL
jgi:surface protein